MVADKLKPGLQLTWKGNADYPELRASAIVVEKVVREGAQPFGKWCIRCDDWMAPCYFSEEEIEESFELLEA